MTLAAGAVIAALLWLLLAYVAIPLPYDAAIFAWLRRQWLLEGFALLVALGACAALRRRALQPSVPRWWAWWAVWWAWAALSVSWSIDRGLSLRALVFYGACGLLAVVAAHLARSRAAARLWLSLLAGLAAAAALEALWQYAVSFQATMPLLEALRETGQVAGWGGEVLKDFLVRKRVTSLFGWPNLFGGFLLLAAPVTAGLGLTAASRRARIGWLGLAGLLTACMLLTLSMGTWIAGIIAAGLAWVWWAPRRAVAADSQRPRPPAAVVILLVLTAVCGASFILAKRARPLILGSTVSRVAYVQGAGRIIAQAPLRGTGIGTFGLAYQARKPFEPVEGQHNAQHAHNTLAEVAAETGLVGFLLFCGFALQCGRHIRAAQGLLARAVALGLLAFFVHSLIEQTFVEVITAPFWWLALGISQGLSEAPVARRWQLPLRWGLAPTGVCLMLAARMAWADAAALQGAWASQRSQAFEAAQAFDRAAARDASMHRYPLEAAERFWQQARSDPSGRAEALREAVARLERVVGLSPWLAYGWRRLGQLRWTLGDRPGAIEALQQAAARDPNGRQARRELAGMLRATGRWAQLLMVSRELQALEPRDAQGWSLAAEAETHLSAAD